LGDAGVGKTSFLEDLIYVRAPQEFAQAIHIYIDLGSKAALEFDIKRLSKVAKCQIDRVIDLPAG
jgi:GTPase SAR1 family protein